MPTGYTAPVKDGEITELADFALSCARGFMPLVLLRDSDQSLEATRRYIASDSYLEKPDYYEREIESATARLAELEAMSDDDALRAAAAASDEVVARNRELEERRVEELARYQDMIAQVEAWEPPTDEHRNFKDFMLKQLRESVDFDCRPFAMPVPPVSLGWRDDQIVGQRRRIERAREALREADERNVARRQWVEALLGSLEAVPA